MPVIIYRVDVYSLLSVLHSELTRTKDRAHSNETMIAIQASSERPARDKLLTSRVRTIFALMRSLCLAGIILTTQACSGLPSVDLTEKPMEKKVEAVQNIPDGACTAGKSEVKPVAPPISASAPSHPTPQLKAGECWAPTVILPRRVLSELEIVTRDAVNDIKVSPATLEFEQRSRIVREGTQTYRVDPPVFKKVTEKVLVREEIRRTVVEPAIFEARKEKVETESAHEALVPCRVPGQNLTGVVSGKALCVKTIPARYKMLTRKILVKPETTREEIEPAIYREVSQWVVETPARAVAVNLPEKTRPLTVQVIETQEKVNEIEMPPIIANINSVRFEGTPTPTWRQIPCAEDLTPELIKQLQTALNKAGFQVGAVDGKLGKTTLAAIQSYQNTHGLASGALTLETMQHLGIFEASKIKAR